MKKLLIYSGIVVAIVLLLAFGLSYWLMESTAARVAQRRAAIAAAGDHVYLTDYDTDPIPDEENAYYYIMLAKADLEAFDKDGEAISDFLAAERRLTPEQVARLAAIVEKYPQMFKQLEQAAACEQHQPQLDYSQGVMMLLPHVQSMRSAARAFSMKSLVTAYRGDGDAALAQCALSLRLSAHLRHEPTLISHLVNVASQRIAVRSANHTLRVAETSSEARARLDAVLAGIDNRQATIDAMKGERAMGLLTFQQFRDGTLDTDGMGVGSNVISSTWLGQAYLNDDEAQYIELLDKQIDAVKLSKRERDEAMKPVWADLEASRFRHVLSRLLVPALDKAADATDRTETADRCLRVLLAIQDEAEVDLEDVDLPAAAKTDPFSGDPLLLKRKDGEWVVYSVGENLLDDGGDVYDATAVDRPLDVGLGPLLAPLESDDDTQDAEMP